MLVQSRELSLGSFLILIQFIRIFWFLDLDRGQDDCQECLQYCVTRHTLLPATGEYKTDVLDQKPNITTLLLVKCYRATDACQVYSLVGHSNKLTSVKLPTRTTLKLHPSTAATL